MAIETLPSEKSTRSTAVPESAPRKPKRKSRRTLWLIIGSSGALMLLMIFSIVQSKKGGKPIAVTVEKAAIRTITQIVSATGKVYPEMEVKLSPEVSGEIVELPVKEGDVVKRGQLLFKINPQLSRTQVEQAQAALSAAKAASLRAKAEQLRTAEEYRRAEQLFAQKLISETEYLAAKTNAEIAKANAEAALFDVERLQSQLKQAREQLSRTVVTSPINGTVTVLSAKLGERVVGSIQMAGTEILRVADLSVMEMRVDVNENDIVNVKLGDTARITIDAYPNRKFTGIVREIANAAKTKGLGTQEEVTNFEVKIRILDHNGLLRPGMSGNADIETFTVKDVLSVPIQSVTVRVLENSMTAEELAQKRAQLLKQTDGDVELINEKIKQQQEKADRAKLVRVVFVKQGNIVRMVPVETGIADNTYIEIKKGNLKAGDEVVSGSYRAISRELKDSSIVVISEFETTKK
ncbi:MAG: efflux RND transporter periplasmic adaptor subunit [Candidatus Thermochlorobacter aerophilum]|jgi:HlyD family secretion protein|uniref:Efflux RND transporter periplasmic adaptor subunit n=1 Tax=Candidatus Thermochlorobacter aerophilus TaxID=1868324 RepID=A0A395M3N1_9BACT|nr:MAG: efflux RND transporter periplasmic adaptor subunit [Candidatus Thermochlorobacter aerophilum]